MITRKLFNPYNKIFEVTFEDGSVITGTYNILSAKHHDDNGNFSLEFYVDVISEPELNPDKYYRIMAKNAIREHILDRINDFILKEFQKDE